MYTNSVNVQHHILTMPPYYALIDFTVRRELAACVNGFAPPHHTCTYTAHDTYNVTLTIT